MPRIARVVIPGVPHHITQRGNRGEDVFLTDAGRRRYLALLEEYAPKHGLSILAYCLMTNHVHLVAVPQDADSLAATLKPVHTRYAQYFNWSQQTAGILWHGRFYSCPMDDAHMWQAVRYVERNPVRAGLSVHAEQYPWSSAGGHVGRRKDLLLSGDLEHKGVVEDWAAWLHETDDEEFLTYLRKKTRTGRPLGDTTFVAYMEALTGRALTNRKVGRPMKTPKQ